MINNLTPEQATAAGIPKDQNGFYYGQSPTDKASFAGYTLPNSPDIAAALANWNPSISGISKDQAFSLLGIGAGVAPAPTVSPSVTATQLAGGEPGAPAGASPTNNGLYAPGSVFGSAQAPLGVTPSNQTTLNSFSNTTGTPTPGSTQANNNRNLISDKPGPGLIKAYDTNNGYKQVYVPAGKYVPGVSLYPQPTNKITPGSLGSAQNLAIPNPTSTGATASSNSAASIAADQTQADIKANIDSINAAKAASETDVQKQGDTLHSQISSLLGQETGKAALTTQKTQELVNPLTQDLTTTNNQIDAIRAQQNALNTDLQGKPVTMSSIIGSQAQENAVMNAQILTLTAHANAVMNNISLAQTHVQQAVDAIYAPIEESISIKQAQLAAIQPQITADEKTQADAIAQEYAAQKQKVDDLKSGINSAMSSAITQGINDPAVLNQILHSTSGTQALAIVAQHAPDASVKDLISKYPDAGITAKDTIAQAQAKLPHSKLYQTATRLAGGSSSSGGGGGNGKNIVTTGSNGQKITIPANLQPYTNTSNSGVAYVDASTLQGTATQKTKLINEAQASGLKVITNKNTALDLTNIQDANNKLDTVADLLKGIDQPGWISRAAYGLGLTSIASLAQSDPQKAAAGILSSIGTDVLKAMQGTQGSRMNATSIAQISKDLPTIYDTADTNAQKVNNIKALLSDRENAILGTSQSSSQTGSSGTTLMTGPDGKQYNVPNDKVDAFTKAGGHK